LPVECEVAWRQIVSRLPQVAVYSCDELAVEVAARLLTDWRSTADVRVARELRSWLVELGFSPRARTNLATAGPSRGRFDELPDPMDEFDRRRQ
jgi:hypothetical protein